MPPAAKKATKAAATTKADKADPAPPDVAVLIATDGHDDAATAELATALRQLLADHADPDPSLVAKLPKGRNDPQNRSSCNVCNGYHTPGMIHLDYVGHADVTRILIETDPFWDWEPYAHDERGLPLMERDRNGNPIGLWIKLTVLGRTVKGYGSVEGGKSDAVKELIGDAIRNAAMRLGIALNLWSKADAASGTNPEPSPPPQQAQRGRQQGQRSRNGNGRGDAPPADAPAAGGDPEPTPEEAETNARRMAAKAFAEATRELAALGDNGKPMLGRVKDKAGALGFPEESIAAWFANPGEREGQRELTQHFATCPVSDATELAEFAKSESVPF